MARPPKEECPVKAVDTTFRIIQTVMDLSGARLTELAKALDLPKSTVGDHLVTLRQLGYLVKEGNEYRVGLQFLELGDHARNYRNTYSVGKTKIDLLAEETNELVHLSVEENGQGVIIHETEGETAVSLDTFVGRQVPLHCTALGKAMLSHMPTERVDQIIEQYGLPEQTPQTITDREELLEHLEIVREQGYATSNGERISELACIAAPITNKEELFGAVSVCVPMTRMESESFASDMPQMVRQTANRMELDLLYY